MTLATGNVLAKVQLSKNGTWELVTGEMQHIFVVVAIDNYGGFTTPGTKTTIVRPTLVVEE